MRQILDNRLKLEQQKTGKQEQFDVDEMNTKIDELAQVEE